MIEVSLYACCESSDTRYNKPFGIEGGFIISGDKEFLTRSFKCALRGTKIA
jgi:hypothetical protein